MDGFGPTFCILEEHGTRPRRTRRDEKRTEREEGGGRSTYLYCITRLEV